MTTTTIKLWGIGDMIINNFYSKNHNILNLITTLERIIDGETPQNTTPWLNWQRPKI